jgi:hypothetical protein
METRWITGHETNGINRQLEILADGLGPGGASHAYRVQTVPQQDMDPTVNLLEFRFQCGPVREMGINGVTNEALLAIVRDRLECFQVGPFACTENAEALLKVREALQWLHSRTRERLARNVEGTNAL